MAVAAPLVNNNTATVYVSLSRRLQRPLSQCSWRIHWETQRNLPTNVCFFEEKERA